jgi:predicted nucleotidyltransferase
MKDIIINKLKEIEETHAIKILYACESGSRGWEFPSPDSDYDVRFIYIRAIDYYLTVNNQEEQLSFPINDELDIYGWDLKKVLKLIGKSNTTPFEWLQSPIIYGEKDDFKNALWEICHSYFNQKSNINHYLGITQSALKTIINEDEIKIKKLFYVLRPLLSARWCLEKNEIAPMRIEPLLSLLPTDLQLLVNDLIALKSKSAEGFIIKIDPTLGASITEIVDLCTRGAQDLVSMKFNNDKIDLFFRKTINYYDDQRTKR